MSRLNKLRSELRELGSPEKAKFLLRFFKTGEGQYGFGDVFIGVTVPQQRIIARKYKNIVLKEVETLLKSPVHEERLTALFILVYQFEKGDENTKKEIYNFYLKNIKYVNNWDLVDSSAAQIVGDYLHDKDKKVLYKLARSRNLWERRISIIATYDFIRRGRFDETLKISEMLLSDRHDLMHKAVGWMLRKVGKRDQKAEEEFLKTHYKTMPRTALRYAIEHFSPFKKAFYTTRK